MGHPGRTQQPYEAFIPLTTPDYAQAAEGKREGAVPLVKNGVFLRELQHRFPAAVVAPKLQQQQQQQQQQQLLQQQRGQRDEQHQLASGLASNKGRMKAHRVCPLSPQQQQQEQQQQQQEQQQQGRG
ncbi:hypothetical protein EBH_0070260 [Eimeria brunetti]|uniref:Uncharacterized protein n=1 Tax=Eimeria brunetti TaxID=51314 RepID=U6LA46_9EIME|nr:hypothetical protein EBH_0070260 [Eimeria brunetti]